MKKMPALGEQEALVLDHVLKVAPVSVREAADHFEKDRGWARTTILTVMERLREKGFLQRAKVEGVFRYTGRVEADQLLRHRIRDFVEKSLGGSFGPLLHYLSESKELSAGEIESLRQLADKLDLEKGSEP